MPTDLLEVLKKSNALSEDPDSYPDDVLGDAAVSDDPEMDSFLAEIDQLRAKIDNLKQSVNAVQLKHTELLSTPQQSDKTKQELNELTEQIKSESKNIQTRLKKLELIVKEREAVSSTSAEARMLRTQHSFVAKSVLEVMNKFRDVKSSYSNACKAQLRSKLELAEDRRVTENELEDMLESGTAAVFTHDVLAQTQEAKRTLADIEARHNELVKLHKDIQEIYELFKDLQQLVEDQGGMIDQIDLNVNKASDHVVAAVSELGAAVTYKKKTRKMKIILFAIIFVVLATLITVLVVVLT